MTKQQLYNYCRDVIEFSNCVDVQNAYNEVSIYVAGRRLLPPDYYISVPCSRCAECRKSYRSGWSFRLIQETLCYKESSFVTLTLDDKYLKEFIDNPKKPLMLYIDRLRKHLGYRPRYFFVPELGDDVEHTGRLHYHGIIFNTNKQILSFGVQRDKWQYGHVFIGYCNAKTCNYIVKYLLKQYGTFKSFILCSNGIGASYLDRSDIASWHINNLYFRDYCLLNGYYYSLPPYYRNKLYSDDIKLYKMLNRVLNELPFERVFNGIKYFNPKDYCIDIQNYYDYTLKQHLSLQPKKFINYATIHSSEAGDYQAFEV